MYTPFRSEQEELGALADEEIQEKYAILEDHIQQVKKQVMPYLEDVKQARLLAEEANKVQKINNLAEEIDPTLEQEDQEDQEEGMIEHPELGHLNPEQYGIEEDDTTTKKSSAIYGKIEVPNEDELKEKTRKTDENQRIAVNTVVKYCRDIVKARVQGNSHPKPEHMMTHGAAGTVKDNQTLQR